MDMQSKGAKQTEPERRLITIINTTDGVVSNYSRKAVRSYSQAWSRRQRKREKEKASAFTICLQDRPS